MRNWSEIFVLKGRGKKNKNKNNKEHNRWPIQNSSQGDAANTKGRAGSERSANAISCQIPPPESPNEIFKKLVCKWGMHSVFYLHF